MLRNIKQPNFRETHASISGPATTHSPYVNTTTISVGGTNGLLVTSLRRNLLALISINELVKKP